MSDFEQILIIGGTHGNEWTGAYLVKNYQETLRKEFPKLPLEFVFANPEAFRLNRRFIHEDLNRAFQFLNEDRQGSFEHERALELRALIHNKKSFVIDLHTTTANMGKTIILTSDESSNLVLASHLKKKTPEAKVIFAPDPGRKYLASQSPFGLMIEVGPVPNGVIGPKALNETLELLREILRGLTNSESEVQEIEVYEEVQDIYYPQNEIGELTAYIHPAFQGKDFTLLENEFKPFLTFDGQEITLRLTEGRYPIFINEAAYYPSKLAFTLCKKTILSF